MTAIVCPRCGKDDMVQKVTSVYGAGILSVEYDMPVAMQWQGKTYYGVQRRTSVSLTALAQKLAPPPEPKKPTLSFIWAVAPFVMWAGAPPLSFILVWFAPMSGRMKLVLTLLAVGALVSLLITVLPAVVPAAWDWGNDPHWAPLLHILGVAIYLIFFILVLAFFIIYYIGIFQEYSRKVALFEAAVRPAWQKAISRWQDLFYCARDDCVFEASTRAWAPADKMNDLLYR